jgi:hypothetical protein
MFPNNVIIIKNKIFVTGNHNRLADWVCFSLVEE